MRSGSRNDDVGGICTIFGGAAEQQGLVLTKAIMPGGDMSVCRQRVWRHDECSSNAGFAAFGATKHDEIDRLTGGCHDLR